MLNILLDIMTLLLTKIIMFKLSIDLKIFSCDALTQKCIQRTIKVIRSTLGGQSGN